MSEITKDLATAIAFLRNGEIVAIPTETVYGLAANAENESAIKKIYALKNRPLNHPLIMHVAKGWDLLRWVECVPDYAQTLIDAFWPGPLTLVLPIKAGAVSPLINGGQSTIAIRCPKHPITQKLLSTLNFPLVAPSANPFGKISPTTAEHVQHSFQDKPLLILDGGRCSIGIESTIVDASHFSGYQILRPGVIDDLAIQAILPNRQYKVTSSIRVPGKMDSHYQPEKPLLCFADTAQMQQYCMNHPDIYVLSFSKDKDFCDFSGYQLPNNPEQMAYELYFQLRQADEGSAAQIAIELPPDTEAWKGVRERLLKAGMLF